MSTDPYATIREKTKLTTKMTPSIAADLAHARNGLPHNGDRVKKLPQAPTRAKTSKARGRAKETYEDIASESTDESGDERDDDADDSNGDQDEGVDIGAADVDDADPNDDYDGDAENERDDPTADDDVATAATTNEDAMHEDGVAATVALSADKQQQTKPKKQRALRTQPDTQTRAQNKTALKALKMARCFTVDEVVMPTAVAVAAVVLIDSYSEIESSETAGLWAALTHVSAASPAADIAKYDPKIAGVDWKSVPSQLIGLRGDLDNLLSRAMDCDRDLRDFRDTFLHQARSIEVLARDPTIADKAPLFCEMVRAAVPAETTCRLEIAFENAATPKQTIVVASNFKDLIRAVLFVMRLPTAMHELVQTPITTLKKSLVPGKDTVQQAIETALSGTGEKSACGLIKAKIKALGRHIGDSPSKFETTRKTQLVAETVVAAAEPSAGHIHF